MHTLLFSIWHTRTSILHKFYGLDFLCYSLIAVVKRDVTSVLKSINIVFECSKNVHLTIMLRNIKIMSVSLKMLSFDK